MLISLETSSDEQTVLNTHMYALNQNWDISLQSFCIKLVFYFIIFVIRWQHKSLQERKGGQGVLPLEIFSTYEVERSKSGAPKIGLGIFSYLFLYY